jgi:hypothetical protein
MKAPVAIQRIELDVKSIGEKGLDTLVSAIIQSAPASALVTGNPALQACVANIKAASAVAVKTSDDVVKDEAQLATDKALAIDASVALVLAVVQYKGLVETTAKSAAEVISTAFTPLEKALPGPQQVPVGIDTYIPQKGHKAKVSAQQTGTEKRYAAQICLDLAANVWIDLEGHGKSHWLTGYNMGTVIWVRFATVRGHTRSAWCTPVSVTIP